MELRKTWFSYLTIGIFLIGISLILLYGFGHFQKEFYHYYFAQGIMILGIGLLWLFLVAVFKLSAKLHLDRFFQAGLKKSLLLEGVFVTLVMGTGLYLRIWVIQNIPLDMESDFLYYYNIAVNLVNGTLEKSGQVDYLAMSPNGFGYPYLLSRIMLMFGTTSTDVCYVTMIVAQAITIFVCYRIGRKLGGRIAGFAALLIVSFWPSQILYSDFNGTEAVSTCLLYVAVLLFVHMIQDMNEHTRRPVWVYTSHILLGVLLELSAALRPVATIFLIAAILCMVPSSIKLKYRDSNNVPICTRFLAKGWLRALAILLGYLICSNVVNSNISYILNRDIGGGGVTFGYSLATGLNLDSRGGYSEDVSQNMKDVYYETGSSAAAGSVMLDRAVEEIKTYPMEIINLIFEKYDVLWANDNYGISSNISSLRAQRRLTQEWNDWLSSQKLFHNFYYFTFVTFAGICGIYLWKRKANTAQVLVLFFVGAIALHSLIEVQNRYHYYMLENFALLSAVAIGFLYQDCKKLMRAKERPEVPVLYEVEIPEIISVPQKPIPAKTIPAKPIPEKSIPEKSIPAKHSLDEFDIDDIDEEEMEFELDEYGERVKTPVKKPVKKKPVQKKPVQKMPEKEMDYIDADVEPEEDHTKFDMNMAIREKHIRVTATITSASDGGLKDIDLSGTAAEQNGASDE